MPHICDALNHCHQLNERLGDLAAELATHEASLRFAHEDINALRALTNKMQGDSADWQNALAHESRKQAEDIRALEAALKALSGWTQVPVSTSPGHVGAGPHCPTCFCDMKSDR